MSLGIFPAIGDGGVTVRDGSGAPTSPPGVPNIFAPPAAFNIINGLERLYGSDPSTLNINASVVNAIISELLALAATMDPTGTWDAQGVGNLAAAFGRWRDGLATDPRSIRNFFARTSVDWNENLRVRLDGVPYNLTGATLTMRIADQAGTIIRTLTIGSGITVVTMATGDISIHVAQSVMATIAPGVYNHEMTMTHGGGLVDEVFSGTLTVIKGII